MHQLAAYFKDLEGFESIIMEEAFASYRITGDSCYIKDIWVHPDHRQKRIASEIADKITEIAKKEGCKYLLGSVYMDIINPTHSAKVLLGYGFKIHSLISNGIVFRKEI